MTTDYNLIGAAGEHLVLSRLLSRGLLASQSPFNAFKADILVNPTDGSKSHLIQVKTRTGLDADDGWHMNVKHETMKDENMFFCFVAYAQETSNIYVIPAVKVATVVQESHAAWLSTPGAKGQRRNDSKFRRIKNSYAMSLKSAPNGWMNEYLEKWDVFKK